MNQTMRAIACFLLISSFILHPSSFLRADGGTIRLSERQGNYRLTVFTTPTPLRAGPVDISVLVQDAATGEPASDVQVMIEAVWRGSPAEAIRHPATTEAATNKLYYAGNFDLPEPGWYDVEVSVAGAQGEAQAHFELEAADRLPPCLALWPWVGWPALAIVAFGIHQILIRRKPRRVATAVIAVPQSRAGSEFTHQPRVRRGTRSSLDLP